jgi:argininosuccinate lyase
LLGFEGPDLNSLHAVADRSFVLRILAGVTCLGVTLDRMATDLLFWSTQEVGSLRLADGLVGSSSMMPQKRNPFVLEHVLGRTASALGAFVAASSAMRGTPYTNSISSGGEAPTHLWRALSDCDDASNLMRLAVSGATPDAPTMRRRSVEGLTCATALSEEMVAAGVPFRAAHHRVGAAILEVVEGRADTVSAALGMAQSVDLEPEDVLRRSEFGGGAGRESFARGWQTSFDDLIAVRTQIEDQQRRWHSADAALWAAVTAITGQRLNREENHEHE